MIAKSSTNPVFLGANGRRAAQRCRRSTAFPSTSSVAHAAPEDGWVQAQRIAQAVNEARAPC
jgi:hypothetical protein